MKRAILCTLFIASFAVAQAQQPVDTANIYYGKPTTFAEFKGGLNGWLRFLEQNLDRDLLDRNGAPQGKYTVQLEFVLSEKGEILFIKSDTDPGYGTREEAIRVILKSSKNWIPAKLNGTPIRTWCKQSITLAQNF
jgi:protein TonB